MFRWVINKIPASMKTGLDYVLISYYEDDCNNYQPNWQRVFDSLHVLFPNSKIGFGECGTSITSSKTQYIHRYYQMHISTPSYIGGYFWWYYAEDCIPFTQPLWSVLDSAIVLGSNNLTGINFNNKITALGFDLKVYPNPFNPITYISYTISKKLQVVINIYDITGRKVSELLSGIKDPGSRLTKFVE